MVLDMLVKAITKHSYNNVNNHDILLPHRNTELNYFSTILSGC